MRGGGSRGRCLPKQDLGLGVTIPLKRTTLQTAKFLEPCRGKFFVLWIEYRIGRVQYLPCWGEQYWLLCASMHGGNPGLIVEGKKTQWTRSIKNDTAFADVVLRLFRV